VTQFWGKYRGKVVDNNDSTMSGRLKVSCPTVLGPASKEDDGAVWATPCVPFAGPRVGWYALPPTGAGVWIEFERGNLDFPIWSGCYWADGEAPGVKDKPEIQVWKIKGITLTLDPTDSEGGFMLEINSPAVSIPMKIACDPNGIEISMASQKIVVSDRSVAINDDALEVM